MLDTTIDRADPLALQDLYEAESLAQLRHRLSEHLATFGFWGVGESCNPKSFKEIHPRDLSNYEWDNFASRIGEERRQDLFAAHREACLSKGEIEENRRLKWLAAHKRPYFAITNATIRFEAHFERCRISREFGMAAADHLVLPLSTGCQTPPPCARCWPACSASRSPPRPPGNTIRHRTH